MVSTLRLHRLVKQLSDSSSELNLVGNPPSPQVPQIYIYTSKSHVFPEHFFWLVLMAVKILLASACSHLNFRESNGSFDGMCWNVSKSLKKTPHRCFYRYTHTSQFKTCLSKYIYFKRHFVDQVTPEQTGTAATLKVCYIPCFSLGNGDG